ncbi:MAG: hypothetical protein EZS28_040061 [Streblomastix strix]|uniref:Uncharacterized protein n=1 Tax=Streblomastix strix TaxID=222440 RepID=A0A5J4U390_9EUKA|nr:MAG: hypothetical protein EZS28_040061 [Streblomastix strix]
MLCVSQDDLSLKQSAKQFALYRLPSFQLRMESDSDDNECATLCNKLGECQIVEQQALLDSVELYAGKGAENPVSDGSNRFYMQFHKTGVYDQIKELLYKGSKEGDIKIWKPPYSELAIQIVPTRQNKESKRKERRHN